MPPAEDSAAASNQGGGDDVLDVVVVGGGLGGLALIVGLEKLTTPGGRQLNFALAEAAEELRTATGTLIGLGPNALVALEGLDPRIVDGLKSAAQFSSHSEYHVRPADPASPDAKVEKNAMWSPLYTLRWAAMQNVLAGLANHSRVRCGHKCTGWRQGEGDDFITVTFKDKPDIRARLVVGADGVRSAVRGAMFPSDPGPRFLGFMNWNALRHVPGSSGAPEAGTIKVIRDLKTGFKNMVMIINAGGDHMFWQLRCTADAPDFTTERPGGGGIPGSKARVLARLRELGWEDAVQEVEATDEAAIYERATWDRLPLSTWSAAGGRVVLLGDSAHAMYSGPGQGARTAFEDSHQLFLALQQHWPDVAAAAAQYEQARIYRATVVQNYAAASANIPELSSSYNRFWDGLDGGDDVQLRFKEFSLWMNSYPEGMHGLPDSKFTAPDTLRKFTEHCAECAQGAKSALYMNSDALRV